MKKDLGKILLKKKDKAMTCIGIKQSYGNLFSSNDFTGDSDY